MWILGKQIKTGEAIVVPMLDQAKEIYDKDSNEREKTGYVLPRLSHQKFNCFIKTIAQLVGINKNLTHHVARHTFATTVTLTNGVPIETVSSMLGHTSIKTTQIYAKVIQQKVSQDMKLLREKMQLSEQKTSSNNQSQAV